MGSDPEGIEQQAPGSPLLSRSRLRALTPDVAAGTAESMPMTKRASGPFEVKIVPQAPEENVGDPTVGRLSISKQFSGDLQGTSRGQMLAVRTEIPASAGYVALERVTGTLDGKTGTFALQHSGTMNRGKPGLIISVVPDSGTGDLAGIAGTMSITIADGKHSYDFEYAIEPAQ